MLKSTKKLVLSGGYNQPQTTPDFTLSFDELMRKAQAGDASAQFLVGRSLRTGDLGAVIDTEEGARWIVKASQNGTGPAALSATAFCCESGLGSVSIKNREKAKQYYSEAIRQGYIPAHHQFARILYSEAFTESVSQGPLYHQRVTHTHIDNDRVNEVVRLMTTASEAGYSPSIAFLGTCYRDGDGIKIDNKEAFKLFRIAADRGCACAKECVGDFYRKGVEGVVLKDKVEAKLWYQAAAAQGYDVAVKLKDLKNVKTAPKKKSACMVM